MRDLFRSWFRRRALEEELREEIDFHLRMRAELNQRNGLSAKDAELRARRQFGNRSVIHEEVRMIYVNGLLEALVQDLRYAARLLRKSPVWEKLRREQPEVLSGVAAWADAAFPLDLGGESRRVKGLFVSGDFYNALGVRPLIGRVFEAADDRPGCGLPGAVVSHGFWRRVLGADPDAVGRTLHLGAANVEVIGVTPAGFRGLEVGRPYDVAVPICSHAVLGSEEGWLDDGMTWWLTVMGRIAEGTSLQTLNAALATASPSIFAATLPAGYPVDQRDDYLGHVLAATPAGAGVSALRSRYGDALTILLAATGFIVLLACTNLANLVLARGSAREREFAVRLAIGASRARLMRQVIVENALLAVLGAMLGLALAGALSGLLIRQLGSESSLELPLDLRLVGFVVAVAGVTCLTFGSIPAWRASRLAAGQVMSAGGRNPAASRRGLRTRQALVVSQVALSLVLLCAAVLFAGTLRNLLAVDTGFRTGGVIEARLDFSMAQVPPEDRRVNQELLAGIRALPGVRSAAEVRHVPMGGTGSSIEVTGEGASPSDAIPMRLNAMSDQYLDTLGIPLLAGRDFAARDTSSSARVAIVNQTFLRRLGLRQADAVGRVFRISAAGEGTWQIVGVVADTKYFNLREEPLPIAFVPILQIPDPRPYTDIMIRSDLPLSEISAAVKEAAANVSPLIDAELHAFSSTVLDGLLRERLMAALSGAFGLLATLVAAIGLYGVMSYLVVTRTNEIGLRMALGASRGNILLMVLAEAGLLLGGGIALGSALALALAGSVQALVFGLDPRGVGSIGSACALLAVVSAVACYVPASRGARLEPRRALRDQ